MAASSAPVGPGEQLDWTHISNVSLLCERPIPGALVCVPHLLIIITLGFHGQQSRAHYQDAWPLAGNGAIHVNPSADTPAFQFFDLNSSSQKPKELMKSCPSQQCKNSSPVCWACACWSLLGGSLPQEQAQQTDVEVLHHCDGCWIQLCCLIVSWLHVASMCTEQSSSMLRFHSAKTLLLLPRIFDLHKIHVPQLMPPGECLSRSAICPIAHAIGPSRACVCCAGDYAATAAQYEASPVGAGPHSMGAALAVEALLH